MEKKISKEKIMAYIFFILITFCKGIGMGASNKIYIAIYLVGTMLVIVKLFNDKFTRKELFILLSLMVIGLMDFFLGKVTSVLFTAISFCCLKNVDIKEIIKIMFWTRVISFISMILLSTTGIIDNNYIMHYRQGIGYVQRYCFGYGHPNLVHSSFSLIIFLWGYLYNKKINIVSISIIEMLNYILYKYTVSRTGFIILTIYLVCMYILKKIPRIKKLLPKILKIALPVFMIISILLAMGYSHYDFVKKINTLVTGRIRYVSMLLKYDIPLIGKSSYGDILIDNGYFLLLYEGGLLATIWYLYMQHKTNKYLIKNKKENEMILTIFFLFYCIFESYYLSILTNPTLLFFAFYIFNSKKELEK